MLHRLASFCTGGLLRHGAVSAARRAVYVYGFELFFSSLSSACSIILLSLCFGRISDALLFLLLYVGLRLFCGGYHAETYARCFISTNLTFLCVLILAKSVVYFNAVCGTPVLTALSCALIFWLAPIRNVRHPLSERTYQRNRTAARALSLLVCALFFIAFFLCAPESCLSISSVSVAAVAVLMAIPKFTERRRTA